jgi:transposase
VSTRPAPVDPRKTVTKIWDVASTTNAITALGDELADMAIGRIVVESTSDYWRPFFYLLEARGLVVWLVNARDVKQAPGRPKTDKLDAVWLAKLNERGMLRPSFVPPREIRELRDYTRLRSDLTRDRSRHKQRLEKLLEDALVKISTVATDIFGKSGRKMIEALIEGTRDPEVLAGMAKGKMRVKHAALKEALTGQFDDHHAELARMLLEEIEGLAAKIDRLTTRIDELISQLPGPMTPTDSGGGQGSGSLSVVERLDEIAGIGPRAAQVIIAEIGLHHHEPGVQRAQSGRLPRHPKRAGPKERLVGR